MTSGGWRVSVLDDEVNTFTLVAYVLHRFTDLPVADAWHRTTFVHEQGSAIVARFGARETAEQLAARLQVWGLHAVVRRDA